MAQPTLFPESGFRRLRIDLAYDGTAFFGWATQPDHRTIQDLVEQAIAQVSRVEVQSIVAGRTDAGVHASGQVIHVDLPKTLELEDLAYKLNRILDEDIRPGQQRPQRIGALRRAGVQGQARRGRGTGARLGQRRHRCAVSRARGRQEDRCSLAYRTQVETRNSWSRSNCWLRFGC